MRSRIGSNVKTIIRQKGYRQNFIATKAGYDPKVFSDMLCGRQAIKDMDIINIMSVLGATPNEIFGISNATQSDS